MIDRNNLNRIKGILSARAGAEIPKFDPGGSIPKYNHNDPDFVNFVNLTKASHNPITWERYQKLKQLNPSASIDQLAADYNSGKDVQANSNIIGAPNVTPTTAVEESAEQIKKIENQKQNQVANIAATQSTEIQQILDYTKPLSPNDGQKFCIPEPAAIPEKLEASAGIQPGETQEGYNRRKQKEYVEAEEKKQEAIYNGIGQASTQALNVVGDYFGAKQAVTDSNLTKGADALYDTAAETVKKLGPAGQVVGTAMGFAGTAGDIIQGLGGGTDQMTTTDKWMDSSFFSWNIGMLNGFGGKRSDAFAADKDILASVGSSYGGTTEDINNAAAKANKKYGLFSSGARRKANRQIADARAKQNLMGDISEEATDQRLATQSMGEQAGLAYTLMTDGGYNQKYTYAAKHGGLLEWNPEIELEWAPPVELNWELPEFKEGGSLDIQEELEWMPEFKEGGKTEISDIPEIEETTQKNVIPEGALHKNKHHMEHAEGLTKKGIPVIDDDGEQQAEIEHSEIIFTLEVTKKLEEYYDIFYSKDSSNKEKEQAALDAGKLLVYQILENTEDRTGLIESCKKGGTLSLKKSTDDLIEEVLEWMPTVVVVEEFKEEPKKKSEKEQMKEAIKEVLIELLTK